MRTVAKLKLTIATGVKPSKTINESLGSTAGAAKAALGPSTAIYIYPPASPAGTTIVPQVSPDGGTTWFTLQTAAGADVAVSKTKVTAILVPVLADDFRILSDTNASGDEDWLVFIQAD